MRAALVSMVAFAVLAACAATSDPLCDRGACNAANAGTIPPDPCIDKPLDPTCLDESGASFVSAKADAASADGSRLHPFTKIGAAIARVSATKRRIYVCAGLYQEELILPSGTTLLGGLACDWTTTGERPRVALDTGVALLVKNVERVAVSDFAFSSNADSQKPGDSSVVAFVSTSINVLFRRVDLTSGSGAAARPGSAFVPNYSGDRAAAGGAGGPSGATGVPPTCTCADGTSSQGGRGAALAAAGGAGTATPPLGVPNGASAIECSGKPGASAEPTGEPARAPSTLGLLTAEGWIPNLERGTTGSIGRPAQGGGGSAATNPNGGSAGGCGGCGGGAGGGGSNGGSSFALLSFRSTVVVEGGALRAGVGASGSDGADGQPGQRPGFGGTIPNVVCTGGPGGYGAGGGGGGGGNGGHAIAIAYVGDPPVVTGADLAFAAAGPGGKGGKGGPTNTEGPNAVNNGGLDGASGEPGRAEQIFGFNR